jgi:acetyl esterase/lipase
MTDTAAPPATPRASPKPGRWRGGRRLLGAAGMMLATACSPVRLLNGLAPDRLAGEGIAYGQLPRQKLDLYRPGVESETADMRPPPMVVFFYGGNWSGGQRAAYRFVGASLAARGCIVVIPDYRLFPEARFPTFLEDCALATRWAFQQRAALGADPGRFFLMGHSAGAYNAAMLGLDPQWLAAVGMQPAELAGVIGIAGPYDFLPLEDDELKLTFGPEEQRARTQPINFVDGQNPPMLLLQGDGDTTVGPHNTKSLATLIRRQGGRVEERIYPGTGHEAIIGALAGSLRFLAPTLEDSLAFIGIARKG